MSEGAIWPDLPLAAWSETCDTLQLWTQIVGKVRIALTPLLNHWWNSTFFVTNCEVGSPGAGAGRRRAVADGAYRRRESRPLPPIAQPRDRPDEAQRMGRAGGQASGHAVRSAAMRRIIRCAGLPGSDRSSE